MSVATNISASIRARLNQQARNQRINFGRLLTNYGLERLLYRLANSTYRDDFVLKGAMLFAYWSGDAYRATKDVDFLKMGDASITRLEQIFSELCDIKTDVDDGLVFDASTIRVNEIREDNHYGGVRVLLKAYLGKAMISIQADIGVGDMITPDAEEIIFPTLLDMEAPKLKAYPVETVLAEKFEAMVSIGFANSRMKDFYDVWAICKFLNPDMQVLSNAVSNTFKRRGTTLPTNAPLALTDAFSKDEDKQKQWSAFVNRVGISDKANKTLHETIEKIRPILMGAIKRVG
jgi:predicted nucleotidyltransferase component of viral defense system